MIDPAVPSSAPVHVVHVTEAPLGGVVAYLEELLPRQCAAGMSVDLVTPEINVPVLGHLVGSSGQVISFPYRRRSPVALLRLAWRTIRHVRRSRPDILHVHSTFAGLVVRLCRAALPAETRLIYCPHGWAFARTTDGIAPMLARSLERRLAGRADRIICISGHEHREALQAGISHERLSIVENGISARPGDPVGKAPPRKDPRPLIGFAGRFDRQKGFDTFVEAVRRIGDGARFRAIGSAITEESETGALPSNLTCLGWQPREAVYAFYREIDLLIVPSRWEGFGLVAAEAMQAGTAVFASRVGGLADIVVDGETGRLFEAEDVDRLVELILTTPAEVLRDMGVAGMRRYRSRYTAERMADEIAALYETVRAPARSGASEPQSRKSDASS